VRVSILRGTQEAAVTTVLDPGESVRLLTPNQDRFLYVAARTAPAGRWSRAAGANAWSRLVTAPKAVPGFGPEAGLRHAVAAGADAASRNPWRAGARQPGRRRLNRIAPLTSSRAQSARRSRWCSRSH
jgi:hypothetical protein